MRTVNITQWQQAYSGESDNSEIYLMYDSETIFEQADTGAKLAESLEVFCGHLKDEDKAVIATRRNSENNGWLALCVVI